MLDKQGVLLGAWADYNVGTKQIRLFIIRECDKPLGITKCKLVNGGSFLNSFPEVSLALITGGSGPFDQFTVYC